MRAWILFAMLGGCFHDTPTDSAPLRAAVPEHRPPADAPTAEVSAGDQNTGFDLYVTPSVPSWTLDGEVRTDRLPVRIRGIVPGKHTVAIDALPGFSGERRVIDVQAGAASVEHIDLKPTNGTLRVTAIEPDKGDSDGGTYVRIIGGGFTCGGSCVRNAKVYFGSRQGEVVRFASSEELIVQAPGGKLNESVDVLIIFEGRGELKIPKGFKFIDKKETGPTMDDLNTGKPEKK